MKIIPLDFNGQAVQFNDAGWFNATLAAERHGKNPHEWLRLPVTKEYIAALNEADSSNTGKSRIWFKSQRGNNGGTWLHPKLAVPFARWLDMRFAVWCDLQIDRLMRGETMPADWQALRHQCAASFKLMADVLRDTRQAEQKATATHHYSNEALLVNEVVTGQRTALDRASLPKPVLDDLAAVEMQNARLLLEGKPYAERKALLLAFVALRRDGGRLAA